MRTTIIGAAVLIAATLAGCTFGDFKSAQSDDVRSLTVNRPYQEVYRSVREYAKKCMEAGLVTAEMKVDAEMYTDSKRAEVRIYLLGAIGKQNHFAIDIEGTSLNTTNVTVRRGIRPLINSPHGLDVFVQAAQGSPPDCHL